MPRNPLSRGTSEINNDGASLGRVENELFTGLNTPLSRRSLFTNGGKLLGAVAIAGAIPEILAACGTASSAATATTAASLPQVALQLVYLENVQFAGSFFALDKGYYKAAGVDVTLLPGGPNIAPEPIVMSGKALVGITHTAEAVQAINNGANLKIIGAGFQKSPTCIASRASAPIHNPTEMIGKKIGISPSNQPIWESFLKANNMTASQMDVVTIGFDPTPLATGEVDAIMAFYTNEPIVLKLKGVDTYAFLLNDYNYPLMEDLYIANAADLADPVKRAQIVGIMTGESKGWSDVLANPDEAATLAVTKYGANLKLNPEQQKLDAEEQNAFVADADTKVHGLFWMTPENVSGTIKSLGFGNVTASPSMFTNEILQSIYKGGNQA
ncbi:MAG: ABC transporter substrate-binding protein [Actinomycetota bacterium]|nr:ABC transporter substrate-binding protein [Actinomycetota bacterium]